MTTEDTATRLLREHPRVQHLQAFPHVRSQSERFGGDKWELRVLAFLEAPERTSETTAESAWATYETSLDSAFTENQHGAFLAGFRAALDAGSERADDVGELVEPGGDWYRVEVLLIRAQSPYYDSALCIEAALGIVKRHADAYRYSRPRYGAPGGPEPVAGWGGDGPIDGPIAHG